MKFLRFIVSFLLLLAAWTAGAQSTRVRGTVTDAATGEPLPFAGVYFDGTTIGISTDLDGCFSLETRSADAKVLTAHLLGYVSQSVTVNKGSFTEIKFSLEPDPHFLEAAYVKPDDRYIKSILKKLDQSRKRNNPDKGESWKSRLYTKLEFDLTNAEDLLEFTPVDKAIGFIREYQDTSAITGKPYIPVMISENISDVYHSVKPDFDREIMRTNRISGLEEDNIVRQFTGSYLLKTNFYEASISVFNLEIPCPAAASSHMFYNYFLVDSLQVEGRKTYTLRFHPKKLVTSPVFDGELQIDAEDFGIRSVHVMLAEASNVNWIRHINIDIENRRLPDGRWFYGQERLFADFSITVSDKSRMLSFLGHRNMDYSEPEFGPITDPLAIKSENHVVMEHSQAQDEEYWQKARPYPLSEREQGIYTMVDDFKETTVFKTGFDIANTFITGYYERKDIGVGFGRWARTFVYNETEGFRIQAGFRTMKEFSQLVRFTGTLAYGFRDKTPKWSFSTEFQLNREKTRKLTFAVKKDFEQLGSGTGVFSTQNMFSSILAREHGNMQSMLRKFSAEYDHEWCRMVNQNVKWQTTRMWSNPLVQFNLPGGGILDSFTTNELSTRIRLSASDERVNRGFFKKTYLFSKYPVLTLDLLYGFKGITRDNNYEYWRAGATIEWKVPSTAIGFGKLYVNGGAIFGSVPYPLLKLHEGNQTFFMDKTAFSCMNYYEFASDRWISGYYEHNFNGLVLGKIPLLKKLDLRELATVRVAWGTLTEANRENAPILLNDNTGSLELPYVEAGVGIGNILRLLRVDAFWRLTHRREDGGKNFTLNIGFDLEF